MVFSSEFALFFGSFWFLCSLVLTILSACSIIQSVHEHYTTIPRRGGE